jgi:hypothetical protein
MNHLLNHKNNYIFIYFGMPLNGISVFFIFILIQMNISCKYKLHMQLQIIL